MPFSSKPAKNFVNVLFVIVSLFGILSLFQNCSETGLQDQTSSPLAQALGASTSLAASTAKVNFTAIELMDNTTKQPVQTLKEGTLIDLSSMPSQDLSIRADLNTQTGVSKVNFLIDNYSHDEGSAPYFSCGDYLACPNLFTVGAHKLTITAYSSTGTLLLASSLNFTVQKSGRPAKLLSALGAKCNGSDDSVLVAQAVEAAQNNAYTLVVNCPATLDIGLNIDKTIFFNNNTTVVFQGTGKFIINNLFEPAFAFVNSTNISLQNWNVEFNASMPVSLHTDGYYDAGVYHSTPNGNGAGQFNDKVLTNWMTKNKGINFLAGPTHGIWAHWIGSVNTGALFFLSGDTSNVSINGLKLYSANLNQPSAYIPFAFSFGENFRSNQDVTTSTASWNAVNAATAFAVPHNLNLENIDLDGVVMGFQGTVINAKFTNITAEHVSDLQDDIGTPTTIGGVGQSFPPPHLFYLNYQYQGDPLLMNSGITITNVNETGPRLGGVRPGGGGFADSLKLGCLNCSVNGYKTNRKDGFMDVLTSNGLRVSNVVASYDSSFTDQYTKWTGWRWPGGGTSGGFKNTSFINVTLTDTASVTASAPVGNCNSTNNANIVLTNVNVIVQSWPNGNILPTFSGLAANSLITFTLKAQNQKQYLKP